MNPLLLRPMRIQFGDLLFPSGASAERRYVIVALQWCSPSETTRILISLAVNAGIITYVLHPAVSNVVCCEQPESIPAVAAGS